ncbi:MAG TPA: hypothetical protein EYP10_04980, partial [Armatimonadetes bacterium]|nr:hypothetical protein [Armatimonadota bacterium]
MKAIILLSAAAVASGFNPAILKVRLDRTVVQPGERVCATYTFTNLGSMPATRRFAVFVHLRLVGKREGTYKMFGADFEPMVPTSHWRQNELIVETHPIRIPNYAAEGEYRVLIGLYERGGMRVPMANTDLLFEGLRYEIARIRVTKRPTMPKPYERVFMSRTCALPVMKKPRKLISIASDEIEVQLDSSAPIVWLIRDRRTGESLHGSPRGFEPEIEVCDKRNDWRYMWTFAPQMDVTWQLHATERKATYSGQVKIDNTTVTTFDLRFEVDGATLIVRFTNVREREGYDFMQIVLREVCAVGEDSKGHLVIPTDSGRDVPVRKAGTQTREVTV